jgi:transcriptional regulator with XRE-family HTH domain
MGKTVTMRFARARKAAGQLVREKRERQGLTQRLLGVRLGVAQVTVSKIELGSASPEITLAALRELGNVPRELRSALEVGR